LLTPTYDAGIVTKAFQGEMKVFSRKIPNPELVSFCVACIIIYVITSQMSFLPFRCDICNSCSPENVASAWEHRSATANCRLTRQRY